jgi:hypothetical protein
MNPFAETSSNDDDDSLVAKVASAVYDPQPFCLHDLDFSDLSQSTQDFLTQANLYHEFPGSHEPVDFNEIFHIRIRRATRLKRALELQRTPPFLDAAPINQRNKI